MSKMDDFKEDLEQLANQYFKDTEVLMYRRVDDKSKSIAILIRNTDK